LKEKSVPAWEGGRVWIENGFSSLFPMLGWKGS
jgi:hypothetical protein